MKIALAALIAAALTFSVLTARAHIPPESGTTAIIGSAGYYDVTAVPCASVPPGTPVAAFSGTVAAPIWTAPANSIVFCRW